jgi:hypothetical protein
MVSYDSRQRGGSQARGFPATQVAVVSDKKAHFSQK